jgi:hypothetical protein
MSREMVPPLFCSYFCTLSSLWSRTRSRITRNPGMITLGAVAPPAPVLMRTGIFFLSANFFSLNARYILFYVKQECIPSINLEKKRREVNWSCV